MSESALKLDAHVNYILNLSEGELDAPGIRSFTFHATEHLRVSGMYWALGAADLAKCTDRMDLKRMMQYVMTCFDPKTGGFGGGPGHDAHMLYTLSAIQIAAISGYITKDRSKSDFPIDQVTKYILSLQNEDGSFQGDYHGEVDTRFTYCAVNGLDVLGNLSMIDKEKTVKFLNRCLNFDGGFGCVPGAESHAGQIFTVVGALAILDSQLTGKARERVGRWLCERQLECGGLNGRPEKLEDVCYSWWVVSSLCALGILDWIDRDKLCDFIISCQDLTKGGFSDRPDDEVDIFHTYFALCGLSMIGKWEREIGEIDPVYALPKRIVAQLGLQVKYQC